MACLKEKGRTGYETYKEWISRPQMNAPGRKKKEEILRAMA